MIKALLGELAAVAAGRPVEVRIPPLTAVQIGTDAAHRRGTPPAVVECSPQVWLELALGVLPWTGAVTTGQLRASGEGSDLSGYLPLRPAAPAVPADSPTVP